MKTQLLSLAIAAFLLPSCVSREATTVSKTDLPESAQHIAPQWKVKANALIPGLILGAGGAYYGYSEIEKYDEDATPSQGAATGGLMGVLIGVYAAKTIGDKAINGKKQVKAKHAEKWVRKFNRGNNADYYMHAYLANGDLILVPERSRSAVEQLNTEIQSAFHALESTETQWSDLSKYRRKLTGNYATFWPDEVAELKQAIDRFEPVIAHREYERLQDEIFERTISLSNLRSANNLQYERNDLLTVVSADDKNALNLRLNAYQSNALTALIPNELQLLEELGEGVDDLKSINDFASRFSGNYKSHVADHSVVSEAMKSIEAYKTDVALSNASALKNQARSFTSSEEVDGFMALVLANAQASRMATLKVSLGAIRDQLYAEEQAKIEQRRKAELKLRQEFAQAHQDRKAFIQTYTSASSKLRAAIQIATGETLPELGDLKYLLDIYMGLIDGTGSYKVDDATMFWTKAEQEGFFRKSYGSLSSSETLYNGGNHIMFLHDYGEMVFSIPNASDNEIALYKMELASAFRKRSSSFIDPEDIPKSGEVYIGGGSAFYSFSVSPDNTLKIYIEQNNSSTSGVTALRVGSDKYELNSWANRTDLYVFQGQEISISVNGSIGIGIFTDLFRGPTGPQGINDYSWFSIDSQFPHACVMGQIGDGPWFLVGRNKTITADRNGRLKLRINDSVRKDNSGSFDVSIQVK